MTSYRVTYPNLATQVLTESVYRDQLASAESALLEDLSDMPTDTSSRRRNLAEIRRFNWNLWQSLKTAVPVGDEPQKCGRRYTEYSNGMGFTWKCECALNHDGECSPFNCR